MRGEPHDDSRFTQIGTQIVHDAPPPPVQPHEHTQALNQAELAQILKARAPGTSRMCPSSKKPTVEIVMTVM